MSDPATAEERPAAEGPGTEFERATRAEPLGGSRYSGRMEAGWFGPPGPNGGVIAALILRAMRAEIAAPDRLPRSLTLHYLRPPAEGDVDVEVAIERSGRSATTCSARMFQGGRLTTIAICMLSTDYAGVASWEPEPPAPPPPADVTELSIPGTPPPMFARLETRPAFGSTPFSGGPEAVTGGWLRTRDGDHLGPELVALFTDAWWPAPFSRLDAPAQAPTLELTIHFRARPSPEDEYALVHFRSEASIDGVFDEQGEVWGADGRLLAQSRQLALLRPWNPG